MTLNINSSEVVKFTDKLERMHRSDLPLAIRGALNQIAKDVKFKYIQKSAEDNFILRNKKFISSLTNYNLSPNTFNINEMFSEVGLIQGRKNIGERVAIQERGGTITNRGHVPTDEIRVGKSAENKISRSYYLSKFKKSKNGIVQKTKNKTIIRSNKGLFQVEKGGKWTILYYDKETVSIDKTNFMQEASEKGMRNIDAIYIKEAEKRISKIK